MVFETSVETKVGTADGRLAKRGWFYGAKVTANSTAGTRVKLYDSLTSTACSSTNLILEIAVSKTYQSHGEQWTFGRLLHNGLYADGPASNWGKVTAWVVDFNT